MTDQPQPNVVDGVPLCSTRDCCRFRCDAEGWWCVNEPLQLNVLFCVPAVRELARKAAALDAVERMRLVVTTHALFENDAPDSWECETEDGEVIAFGTTPLAAIEACVAAIKGKEGGA